MFLQVIDVKYSRDDFFHLKYCGNEQKYTLVGCYSRLVGLIVCHLFVKRQASAETTTQWLVSHHYWSVIDRLYQ